MAPDNLPKAHPYGHIRQVAQGCPGTGPNHGKTVQESICILLVFHEGLLPDHSSCHEDGQRTDPGALLVMEPGDGCFWFLDLDFLSTAFIQVIWLSGGEWGGLLNIWTFLSHFRIPSFSEGIPLGSITWGGHFGFGFNSCGNHFGSGTHKLSHKISKIPTDSKRLGTPALRYYMLKHAIFTMTTVDCLYVRKQMNTNYILKMETARSWWGKCISHLWQWRIKVMVLQQESFRARKKTCDPYADLILSYFGTIETGNG